MIGKQRSPRRRHQPEAELHVVRVRENARDDVLELREPLGAHLRGHVDRDAAIPLEAVALIGERLAAEAAVARAVLRAVGTTSAAES
jgi:hypothetical protein